MRLQSIHLHPLKSGAIRDVAAAEVEAAGLRGDRRWMLVDAEGEKISARTDRRLFTVQADTVETDPALSGLRLRAPGLDDLLVDEPEGPLRPVSVFGDPATGVDAGDAAATWLAEAIGRAGVRLVHCARPADRALDPEFSQPGDHTGYPDGFPLLLTTPASLAQLQDRLTADALERGENPVPLTMRRFRPNVVVDAAEPFVEESWSRIRIGAVDFAVVKTCARCVMTTIDPDTLAGGKEPLRTLARHHRVGSSALFGMNLIPLGAGRIQVGDEAVAG